MPATFTESDAIDMSKEKDWAFQIACLDWDKTKIVFTKRELLEFLSSVGVTVDSNLMKIQKLPRYAKFGKFSNETAPVPSNKDAPAEEAAPADSSTEEFKPTRRVRDAPGGKTSVLFGDDGGEAEPATETSWKPTRRVRDNPGGEDHLNDLFS